MNDLHRLPAVAITITGGIGGIGLIHIKVFLIDRKDGESPGPASVVADRDAGKSRLAGADHVPAGSDQVHPVPERRHLQRPMRVVGHDRAARWVRAPETTQLLLPSISGSDSARCAIRQGRNQTRPRGRLTGGAVPIAIHRLNILGIKTDRRARCRVSVEERVANQGKVDRTIGLEALDFRDGD